MVNRRDAIKAVMVAGASAAIGKLPSSSVVPKSQIVVLRHVETRADYNNAVFVHYSFTAGGKTFRQCQCFDYLNQVTPAGDDLINGVLEKSFKASGEKDFSEYASRHEIIITNA